MPWYTHLYVAVVALITPDQGMEREGGEGKGYKLFVHNFQRYVFDVCSHGMVV